MAEKSEETVKKSSSNTTTESRASKRQISTAAIETIRNIVDIIKPYELSKTQRLKTFQAMMLDDAVGNAFGASAILVERAFASACVDFDKNDPESVAAAEFLEYCIDNMTNQTLRSVARNAIEFKRDGLAPLEKVFKKEKDGDWTGYYTINKLSYIHPLTLEPTQPFTVKDGGNTVTELRQSINAFRNSNDILSYYNGNGKGYVSIPRNKVTFFTYSATDAQPFGQSPFEQCYTAWREKTLIQDYTLVGVTKDFSGTPVLYIPEEILAEASANPDSQSAVMVEQLKNNMANMHTGDQCYTVLPSSTLNEAGTGEKAWEIKFLGVEGGGKNFQVNDLVEQRKKAIYNCFGAANLITGETGGSYNLIEGQNSIHTYYVERDISVIEEGWNKDIIPQLFRLNGWKLTHKQMPKIKAGEVQPVSIDENGKYIQRIASVGMMPLVPETVNHFLEVAGIKYRVEEGTPTEELREIMSNFTSNAGEGDGTSGTGDSQSGGANSATNSENKA